MRPVVRPVRSRGTTWTRSRSPRACIGAQLHVRPGLNKGTAGQLKGAPEGSFLKVGALGFGFGGFMTGQGDGYVWACPALPPARGCVCIGDLALPSSFLRRCRPVSLRASHGCHAPFTASFDVRGVPL